MPDVVLAGQPGKSPFDKIRRVDGAGEYWLAREMQPFLGYAKWQNMEVVIRKAKASCRNTGKRPEDHFTEVSNMVPIGSGATRSLIDFRLSRHASHLVAMNADPEKEEVALAQAYFSIMTRAAELGRPAPLIGQPSFANRPWSMRFAETTRDHMREVYQRYPDGFTVATTLVTQMLGLEDELVRHLFEPQASDRPDVSIGLCWANHRRELGMPPAMGYAPLYLPDKQREVSLSVYPNGERGTCERWFFQEYMPEKLPAYFRNKPEFGLVNPMSAVSAADNACQKMTGSPAKLRPIERKVLVQVGGFFPVGTAMPRLEDKGKSASPQKMLWD